MRQQFVESAISADDELLEKYLEGEEIPAEALQGVVRPAILSGDLVPVLSVASLKGAGVDVLLDFLAGYAPTLWPGRVKGKSEPSE